MRVIACVAAFTIALSVLSARGRVSAQRTELTLVDAASAPVAAPPSTPRELSGLTYAGRDLYYAVSDNSPALYPLSVHVDSRDGTITSITAADPIVLRNESGEASGGTDLEGVAFDAVADEVLTINESGLRDPRNTIIRFRRSDWRKTGSIDLTGTTFTSENVRAGLGPESLTLAGHSVWTCNEEAFIGDGPRATRTHGTTVRLTRFDEGRMAGQWAYVTERSEGALPYLKNNEDGVSDLLALPDGRLLVLERATYASQAPADLGGFISRIYEVDFARATDITVIPRLAGNPPGGQVVAVRKRVLWQRAFSLLLGPNNFEGLALGPTLADGSRSVILVADNDILPSTFWALRLTTR